MEKNTYVSSGTRGEFTSYKPAFSQAAFKLAQSTRTDSVRIL
jgi:hypothetical protein